MLGRDGASAIAPGYTRHTHTLARIKYQSPGRGRSEFRVVMTYRGGGDNCDCFIRECQSQFGTLLTSLVSYMTYPLTPAGSREYNCAFLCTMTVIASRHVNDRVLYVPDLVSHQSPPPLSPHSVTDLQSYKYHPNRPLTSPIGR